MRLARADVDHARVRRCDGERADRERLSGVEDWRPGRAAVEGTPDTALRRSEVDLARVRRIDGDRGDTTADSGVAAVEGLAVRNRIGADHSPCWGGIRRSLVTLPLLAEAGLNGAFPPQRVREAIGLDATQARDVLVAEPEIIAVRLLREGRTVGARAADCLGGRDRDHRGNQHQKRRNEEDRRSSPPRRDHIPRSTAFMPQAMPPLPRACLCGKAQTTLTPRAGKSSPVGPAETVENRASDRRRSLPTSVRILHPPRFPVASLDFAGGCTYSCPEDYCSLLAGQLSRPVCAPLPSWSQYERRLRSRHALNALLTSGAHPGCLRRPLISDQASIRPHTLRAG